VSSSWFVRCAGSPARCWVPRDGEGRGDPREAGRQGRRGRRGGPKAMDPRERPEDEQPSLPRGAPPCAPRRTCAHCAQQRGAAGPAPAPEGAEVSSRRRGSTRGPPRKFRAQCDFLAATKRNRLSAAGFESPDCPCSSRLSSAKRGRDRSSRRCLRCSCSRRSRVSIDRAVLLARTTACGRSDEETSIHARVLSFLRRSRQPAGSMLGTAGPIQATPVESGGLCADTVHDYMRTAVVDDGFGLA
jgi:hypothetical protein